METRGFRGLEAVDVWIFDLDNTLYPASCNLFAEVDQRIGAFIARHFAIPFDEARGLQKRYFRDYGTTLRGLMIEHDVDPVAFLDDVHAIDVSPVAPSPALDRALGRLPGRKIIHTNGSTAHAFNVTERLGVSRHFEAVYDIVAAGYVPKPDPRPYGDLVARHKVDPARACMVEDLARNLAPAKALGMTTVWVRSDVDWAQPEPGMPTPHIDHVADDLIVWLEEVAAARERQRGPVKGG